VNDWIQKYVQEPMKINKPKSDDDMLESMRSGEYFAETKKDGALYQLVKTPNGEVHLFSRTLSKKTGFFVDKIDNVPHIKEWAQQDVPNDTILIGEIYYPGKTSKDVTKVMGCLPDKAIGRQYNNPIHFYMFDCIRFAGKSLLQEGNLHRYETIRDNVRARVSTWESWLEIADIQMHDLERYLENTFAAGEEGIVLKQIGGLYKPGKRPVWNKKVKTEDTVDAVVVDFIEPERVYTGKELDSWPYWEDSFGKKIEIHPGDVVTDDLKTPVTKPYFNGWKVGFVVAALNEQNHAVPIASVTSGLTDFMRGDCAVNPQNYIGKVAEIQCMSVDKEAHTLRHPRLVRVREADDKSPQDCTFKNIFR